MIYRKEEYVQHDESDSEFPIKQIDMLEATDGSRTRFIGRAALNMQTPFGMEQLPVSFEIAADSVEAAFEKYVEAARPQIEEVKQHIEERLDELRRSEQSRIVTPAEGGAGGGIIRLDDLRSDS
ncbi:MAG: hypothetical protein ACYS8K_03045 [Planctomycetota bacterium]|jgi:hypothetical protein